MPWSVQRAGCGLASGPLPPLSRSRSGRAEGRPRTRQEAPSCSSPCRWVLCCVLAITGERADERTTRVIGFARPFSFLETRVASYLRPSPKSRRRGIPLKSSSRSFNVHSSQINTGVDGRSERVKTRWASRSSPRATFLLVVFL